MTHRDEKRRVGFSPPHRTSGDSRQARQLRNFFPLPSLRDTFPRKRGKGMICAFHHYPRSYIAWQILPLTRCGGLGLKHTHPVFFAVSAHSSPPLPTSAKNPPLYVYAPRLLRRGKSLPPFTGEGGTKCRKGGIKTVKGHGISPSCINQ